jgi:hypothetical protein
MTDTTQPFDQVGEMRAEYDFHGGIRSKHYREYRQGHTVKIHQEDGSVIVQEYKLEEHAVIIEPDVREYFPDSESVNNALRSLIALIPEKRKSPTKSRRQQTHHKPKTTASQPAQPSSAIPNLKVSQPEKL